jgi:hypothetical protein
MGTLIAFIIATLVATLGYRTARRFVRERLRYVDAAHGSTAPWIAGGVAALVAAVLAAVLPFVGLAAALAFGVSVALGVAAGARDLKTGRYLVSDGH